MKILVVTHYFESHGGGVEIVAGHLCREYLHAGHEVVWAAADCDSPPVAEGLAVLPLASNNWLEKATGLPFPTVRNASRSQLREAIANCDAIHAHEGMYQACRIAVASAAKRQMPIVVTQHIGWIPYKSAILRLALSSMHRFLTIPTLMRARNIVFISKVVESYFHKIDPKLKMRSSFIANGIDLSRFHSASQRMESSRINVLFAGRFVERKGLDIVRMLAERRTDITWKLAGAGPIDPRTWNLKNVEVLGRIDPEELAVLYRNCDLVVLPSLGEGFPLVAQESLASGVPIMLNAEVGEALGQELPGVISVPNADPETWKHSYDNAIADKGILRTLGENGALFARTAWSWKETSNQYLQLFNGKNGRQTIIH